MNERAEQNRLKALEIRKRKMAAQGVSETTPCPPGPLQSTARPTGTVESYETPAKKPQLEATKTTSQLSPEVLKRIEENRRKALEKREALRREREQSSSVPQVSAAPVATCALAPTTTNTKSTMAIGVGALQGYCTAHEEGKASDPAEWHAGNVETHFHDFGVRYCEGKKEAWSWTYNGSSNTDELQIILQCCVLIRRLKSEVLSQLPPKQRMTVVLDSDLISKKRLKTFDKQNWNFENLESSDSLQQFAKTVEVKVDAVRAYLKEVLESGSKFLVFGHHSMMLDAICSLCQDTKTKFIRIDGSTSPEERMARTSKFQNHEDVRVAVLSITAASTGITLTAAQLVIFAELYWNPGILVQAEDRAHRIGQQDSVTVQYLLAKNTVDDHIWPLLQTKLEVLGKVGLSDDKLNKNKMSYQKV
ncbi:SWI/SNF-related matrix-associated actin-dependent regulator of chromatin subfamily A-like protein 1 [Portunus trituberculatus]|uniref:SWI/SNF-related matrix-associated actin-dependent regulator of chromatin subfamily A-like protein 1 n=1 Tax=Portunus trituberculatus TaxID=210409 RepID=A0A5B7CFH9_PORTR|nr:SWI/SNF-related matrix-associated actin-dependent regulator of chromatin subfamily A-like protein 1 [Portunus trituberculatus]